MSGSIEIDATAVIIRDDYNNFPLDVGIEDGNVYIESPRGIVCKEALRAADIISFVKNASEKIEKEIRKYSISEEDRKLLERIIEELD